AHHAGPPAEAANRSGAGHPALSPAVRVSAPVATVAVVSASQMSSADNVDAASGGKSNTCITTPSTLHADGPGSSPRGSSLAVRTPALAAVETWWLDSASVMARRIPFAMGTPSLHTIGVPHFFSMRTQ